MRVTAIVRKAVLPVKYSAITYHCAVKTNSYQTREISNDLSKSDKKY